MSSSRPDSNRIVIAVTGANSGLGYGYCQRILRQLSVHPTEIPEDARQVPCTTDVPPRLLPPADPSLSIYAQEEGSRASETLTTSQENRRQPPPTLTLILACRSRQKAEVAIKQLRKEHELGLIGRKLRGKPERPGWLEGLEIVFEELDVDKVGGRGGILDFAARIKANYPHLSTLVLNAGMGAFKGINWPGAARQFFTDLVGAMSQPDFIIQEAGWKSGDGERGAVWGVNVLSGYILAKELHSHLARSPRSLPLSPRIIYVSSSKALPKFLPQPPSSDRQLLREVESYDASKFMADVVSSRLDWDFSRSSRLLEKPLEQASAQQDDQDDGRAVRFLRLDPGVVYTGIFVQYLPLVLEWCMVAAFYIARWIGSTVHVITPDTAALGLTWLTLAPDASIQPACPPISESLKAVINDGQDEESNPLLETNDSPAKYMSRCWRTGRAFVEKGYVSQWAASSEGPEGGDGFVEECERVYAEWKTREN